MNKSESSDLLSSFVTMPPFTHLLSGIYLTYHSTTVEIRLHSRVIATKTTTSNNTLIFESTMK